MKLSKHLKDFGLDESDIPKIPYLPAGKNVLIYRCPSESQSSGGIIFAEVSQELKTRGVLMAAGLAALDIMKDHLIEIGDIVDFGMYAGSAKDVDRKAEMKGRYYLQMKIDDILGSVDALDRLKDYAVEYVEVEDQDGRVKGQHFYTSKRKAA